MVLPKCPVASTRCSGEQFEPEFLAISPNNRMPAIVDHDPIGGGGPLSIFESGAILLYLAEKSGRFLPTQPRGRYDVTQWLFWQIGGLGPMLGQHGHFKLYAPEPIAYGIERYGNEARRLYNVMNERLADREFLAGEGMMKQKWPEQLEHVAAVPRNPSGKLLKADLRERYEGRPFTRP